MAGWPAGFTSDVASDFDALESLHGADDADDRTEDAAIGAI